MNMKLSERLQFEKGIAPQDITTEVTSNYYTMKGRGKVLAVVKTATIAEGSKATVQLMQATDDQGSNAKTLGNAVEKTADTGGEELLLTAEVDATELDLANDFSHVAVQVTSDNETAVDGVAVLVFGDLSFRG